MANPGGEDFTVPEEMSTSTENPSLEGNTHTLILTFILGRNSNVSFLTLVFIYKKRLKIAEI